MAREVSEWIELNLPGNYPWPGNVRELEQCFRNVMIHGRYLPMLPLGQDKQASPCEQVVSGKQRDLSDPRDPDEQVSWQTLQSAMQAGRLTADELVRQYCQVVHAECGSYQKTAQRLGLDRRTVRRKLMAE